MTIEREENERAVRAIADGPAGAKATSGVVTSGCSAAIMPRVSAVPSRAAASAHPSHLHHPHANLGGHVGVKADRHLVDPELANGLLEDDGAAIDVVSGGGQRFADVPV